MHKKLIIFATYQEAQASIEKFKATKDKVLNNKYVSSKFDIIISGIGILNALFETMTHGKKYSMIINIGFSGIINNKLSIGAFYEIKTISKLNFTKILIKKDLKSLFLLRKAFPKIQLPNNSSISIASSDIPIRNSTVCSLCHNIDLVDMEAYGIAFSSKKLNIPCRIFKMATDFPSLKGRRYLEKNFQKFSKKISNFILEII